MNENVQALSTLHEAIEKNDYNQVQIILANSHTDVNKTNYLNETPLVTAIRENALEIADLILSHGDIKLDIQSYLQGTALTAAIFNMNMIKKFDEETAKKYFALVFKLLGRKSTFDDKLHPRAFLCAVESDNEQLINELIKRGANINATGEEGYKKTGDWIHEERFPSLFVEVVNSEPVFELPIIVALKKGNKNALKLLIANNVRLDLKGTLNESALSLLASNEITEEIKQFVLPLLERQNFQSVSKIENLPTFFNGASAEKQVLEKSAEDDEQVPEEQLKQVDRFADDIENLLQQFALCLKTLHTTKSTIKEPIAALQKKINEFNKDLKNVKEVVHNFKKDQLHAHPSIITIQQKKPS